MAIANDLHVAGVICDREKNDRPHVLKMVLADRYRDACHSGLFLSKRDHDVRVRLEEVIGVARLGRSRLAGHRGGLQRCDRDLSTRRSEPCLRIYLCFHKHLYGSLAMSLRPRKPNIRHFSIIRSARKYNQPRGEVERHVLRQHEHIHDLGLMHLDLVNMSLVHGMVVLRTSVQASAGKHALLIVMDPRPERESENWRNPGRSAETSHMSA